MRSRRSLETLERLKRQRVESGRVELSVKLQQAEEQRRARSVSETELSSERARTRAVLEHESERMQSGAARAGDLKDQGEFLLAARVRDRERELRVQQAHQQELAADARANAARAALGRAEAEARALERYQARFEKAKARVGEQRAEEAASLAHQHRVPLERA